MSAAAGLDGLESRRLQLEENIAKLRKSLQHWRTWDAEYEGLKEEIAISDELQSAADCSRISDALGGELVNLKEISELYGASRGSLRSNDEVGRLVDRRQDYVQQNITTISKQLRAAEGDLQIIFDKLEEDDAPNSSGLPITEIIEELDEEGNVISSKISQPETATAQIIDTLRKAGLSEVGSADNKSGDDKPQQSQESTSSGKKSVSFEDTTKDARASTKVPERKGSSDEVKKSVKFADHIQEHVIPSVDREMPTVGSKSGLSSSLLQGSFNGGERVIELDDDDDMVGVTPIIPDDESPEDARLRREMLQYSLNEVGSVVAELDLDETYSDDDDDYDFGEDAEDYDASDISEEEDEYGRSIRKGVSKSYRQQMLDLEEKLSARMIENLGPSPDEDTPEIDPDDLRTLVIRKEEGGLPETPGAKSTTKKGVRFADALDISEAPIGSESTLPAISKTPSAPMSDIVERSAPQAGETTPIETGRPAKASRFKQHRNAAGPLKSSRSITHIEPHVQREPEDAVVEKTNEGPVLSNKIVERPSISSSAPAPDDDEFDPELQQRQLASEYYRIRNTMIQQQGGFRATEDELDQPLMEERDGKMKKVSRFKAARLNL